MPYKSREKRNEAFRAYYRRNRAAVMARNNRWRKANPEKVAAWLQRPDIRARHAAAQRRWKKANPDKVKAYATKSRRKQPPRFVKRAVHRGALTAAGFLAKRNAERAAAA